MHLRPSLSAFRELVEVVVFVEEGDWIEIVLAVSKLEIIVCYFLFPFLSFVPYDAHKVYMCHFLFSCIKLSGNK